jgi:hypothetical protein
MQWPNGLTDSFFSAAQRMIVIRLEMGEGLISDVS